MAEKYIIKRDGSKELYDFEKIHSALDKAFVSVTGHKCPLNVIKYAEFLTSNSTTVEEIQDAVEKAIMVQGYYNVAKAYIIYREEHKNTRKFVSEKRDYIKNFAKANNTANATIDDNSNVATHNIANLNTEIHKEDNIKISRGMVMSKLKELFPEFNNKNYIYDLNSHLIYKHDESSFAGAIAPYCVSITMYPFLLNGLKDIGGLSAAPKNLDSYCGMFCNLIFAVSAQYAGAVAVSEALLYFTYFCKKEWGNDFYLNPDKVITQNSNRDKTIRSQIHQYWQQIIYTINQPAAARGYQSAFVNFSYFDKPFFEGMFGEFTFPDGTHPDWESLCWIQKEFMQWFNAERLRTIMTYPVESVTLLYKDGKFVDEDMYNFVCEEYSRGHSFFTYISDSVDSLSSCCFSKDQKVLWKSSTNGVNLTTLSELYNMKWEPNKKNLRIFHNGSWVSGKPIELPNRKMYKVVTENNKEIIVTDTHINVTLDGEKKTQELTTDDYLMFNTMPLNAVSENDEHLTYEQGFVVGAFLGDGSFGSEINGCIYDINFSQNAEKYEKMMEMIDTANRQLGCEGSSCLNDIYNNVYPVRISSKGLAAFIMRWTNWKRSTYAYNKELNLNCLLQSINFRRGILDGWYNTDGGNSNRCYTSSRNLAEDMEILITSLGMQSIIDISDGTDEKVIIRDKEYNRNYPLYCVRWYEEANHRVNKNREHTWVKKNNSIYFKIKSIEEVDYRDKVYCIECKNETEPYFTLPNGIITHNCRLKNKIQTKEFNFTNGNIGVQTGSKSVITLNLNRIIQNWSVVTETLNKEKEWINNSLKSYLVKILERVYKYHIAYNELLWDMYDSNLLPIYKAGFINLNKQYLTIGLNGLNEAAEFLGIKCSDNKDYQEFCQLIFSTIKDFNTEHNGNFNGHKITLNTECVPAESLSLKNYNWDKNDGLEPMSI